MLKELLNQKVKVGISSYSYAVSVKGIGNFISKEGIVTDVDDNFVKFDDGMIIAIKAITYIQPIY